MPTYSVRYSRLFHQYLVINTETRDMQSAWPTQAMANQVAARLNRIAALATCGTKAG